jgi:hypothetical protein
MPDFFEKRNIVTITTPSIISDTRESRKHSQQHFYFTIAPPHPGSPKRTACSVVLQFAGHVLQLGAEVLDYDTGDYLLSSHTSAGAHNLPLS